MIILRTMIGSTGIWGEKASESAWDIWGDFLEGGVNKVGWVWLTIGMK